MSNADLHARLQANLSRVRQTIANACRRAGRDPVDVRLVAVTKYVDLDVIRALCDIGLSELGENRVQQLGERAASLGAALRDLLTPPDDGEATPNWHMIGHLQRNKVRLALRHTRILHSLDSLRLLEEVEKEAARIGADIDALIEVNVAGERSKSGVAVSELRALAEATAHCKHVHLRGLMTMAPFEPDPEAARPHFASLRELLDALRSGGVIDSDCQHLSMGMTNDFAVAVEEGATFVRIGSALFEGL